MIKLRPRKQLRFHGKLSHNWEQWANVREKYIITLFTNGNDNINLQPVMAKFDKYVSPKKNKP